MWPNTRHTGQPRQTIDAIVTNISYYVNICEEQSAVFREHVEEVEKEYALYVQSADVVKPGQRWQPEHGERDAYIAEMARRCTVIPQTIADRVKIYFAAHAILACTVFIDMAQHTGKAQGEILSRSNKCRAGLIARGQFLPSPGYTQSMVKSLMRSTRNPDHALFGRDPTTIVNKQFILEEEGDELLYEVVEIRFSKGGWLYLVRFEGCSDTVNVPSEEMMAMLKRSSLVEA